MYPGGCDASVPARLLLPLLSDMARSPDIFERLEMKYLISEGAAEKIRKHIAPYCAPDKHNGLAGLGYPITSLYFDTPTLLFHRTKLRGDPDRMKLRARVYDGDGPVHLEIKRKCVDVVHKTRVAVDRAHWKEAVAGYGQPLDDTPRAHAHLGAFAHLAAQSGAEPTLLVRYEREAYASQVDNYARVTFDRNITAMPCREMRLDPPPGGRWHVLDGPRADRMQSFTLLELKAELLVPYWMSHLVQQLNLQRKGFSKYSQGIIACRNDELGLDAWQRGAYA